MNSDDMYLLQDGTHAAPGDCKPGKDGVLRHTNGLAVALHEDGSPQTVGGGAVENKNVEAAEAGGHDTTQPVDIVKEADLMPAMEAKPAMKDVKSEPVGKTKAD